MHHDDERDFDEERANERLMEEEREPQPASFTCNQCGTTGSARWMTTHNCAHNQYVSESGGRCEDYPCCGHTDGDGCYAQESHTSGYWHDMMERLERQGYDPHEMDLIMSGEY